MVNLTRILFGKARDQAKYKAKFVDTLRIYARGGPGGTGLPSYGGCGGRGGHVYVVPDTTGKVQLRHVMQKNPKKRFVASAGANSKTRSLLGEPGQDLEIKVPLGVCVKNDDGKILADIDEDCDRVLIARGGEGGNVNNNFVGKRGEATNVRLDLKLIADVGLVGFPNAGKSTFMSAVSRAAPKIAAYPFTTLRPQLGTMVYEDNRSITLADLPGLIEGSYMNFGMGHSFLKHVERTKILLFMVDIHGFQLSDKYQARSAVDTVLLLNKELELFKEELAEKPAVLALNKIDADGAEDKVKAITETIHNLPEYIQGVSPEFRPEHLIQFDDIIPISAKEQLQTDYVKERLRKLLDFHADLRYEQSQIEGMHTQRVRSGLSEHYKEGFV